jgi:hypothetical protein
MIIDDTSQIGSTARILITKIAHEYLAPYRSHAHCQMRSMPGD